MTPATFPQMNRTYAKNQPGYVPLPAHIDQDGVVTSCWKTTSWRERLAFVLTGKIWLSQLTFGTRLQPQKPTLLCPLMAVDKKS